MNNIDNLKEIMLKENLVYPDATLQNIIDVVRTIYTYCSANEEFIINDSIKNKIPNKKNIILILVDGMGSNLIDRLPASSLLRKHRVLDINTIFPTTTGCVLPSIAMAKYPATHGIYGSYSYNPDLNLNFKTLQYLDRESLESLDINPDKVFKYPSVMNNLKRKNHTIFPENIVNSKYSSYVVSENKRKGYSSYEEIPEVITNILNETFENFIYLYISNIDTCKHKYSPYSEEVSSELSKIEALIEEIVNKIDTKDTEIIITADHGQLPIKEVVTMNYDKYQKYFYTLPMIDFGTASYFIKKSYQKEFVKEFNKDYKDKMYLFLTDELYNQGFFGNEKTIVGRAGLGEYISMCKPGITF